MCRNIYLLCIVETLKGIDIMEQYDVFLINPPSSNMKDKYEHLGLAYIAAFLRKEHISVKIVDMPLYDLFPDDVICDIKQNKPKLIGVSIPFQDGAIEALSFIKRIKETGYKGHLSIGGIYPTFSYDEILMECPQIDTVVLGEGEITFTELAKKILKDEEWKDISGIVYKDGDTLRINDKRPLIDDLDSMPYPERDTLPIVILKSGFASILTSRGCYGRCSFCSVGPFFSQFGQKYRQRSVENVIGEIKILYEKYNVRNLFFNDAEFVGGKGKSYERAYRLAEEIIRSGMNINFSIQCRVNDVDKELFTILKKAGLKRVFLGVESGSQTVLDRFKKDVKVEDNINALKILNDLDLYISMGFIMFDPHINFKELSENISFINNAVKLIGKEKLDYYPISRLLPLAGTEVERDMKEKGLYKGNSLNYNYDFDDKVMGLIYNLSCGVYNLANNLKWRNRESDSNTKWIKR
ncbi:MAG: radical SAM protein [Thermoanaerobacterium sp.]|nr:radical SAM protein [Thermoanaerobacterium sp.]